MRTKTRPGNGQPGMSDGLLNHREPGGINMQPLTRIFSKGLAVAFVMVVLAVSLTPAYGRGTDQEFKFGIRGGSPLKHR